MSNENTRVVYVLDALKKCTNISQVICVDDGSTDGSGEVVKKMFGEVVVLRHEKNLGKLQAVKTGLHYCNNENIILMDADLKNIIPFEIDRAIKVFEKNKLDCLLLCTRPMNMLDSLARHFFRLAHVAMGCRIIKKKVLEPSLNHSGLLSYHLEPAQNKYLMDNHGAVAYVNISAKGILKSKKVGFLKGLQQELRMWYELLSYAGIIYTIKQSLLFARKKETI